MLKLLEYEHIQKEGSCVIGEASFYLTKIRLTCRRVKHMKKGDRVWFNWPSYCTEDGQNTQWFPYCEFAREDSDKIFEALKIEVANFLKEEEEKEMERLNEAIDKHPSNSPESKVKANPEWADHYFNPDFDENAEVLF